MSYRDHIGTVDPITDKPYRFPRQIWNWWLRQWSTEFVKAVVIVWICCASIAAFFWGCWELHDFYSSRHPDPCRESTLVDGNSTCPHPGHRMYVEENYKMCRCER